MLAFHALSISVGSEGTGTAKGGLPGLRGGFGSRLRSLKEFFFLWNLGATELTDNVIDGTLHSPYRHRYKMNIMVRTW